MDCFTKVVGTVRSEAHSWQLVVTRSTALSISISLDDHLQLVARRVAGLRWTCKADGRPSRTWRGTIIG